MFQRLFKRFYVQTSPQLLSVRDALSGQCIAEVPEIAIHYSDSNQATVLAVGSAARNAVIGPNIRLLNPFTHPAYCSRTSSLLRKFCRPSCSSCAVGHRCASYR